MKRFLYIAIIFVFNLSFALRAEDSSCLTITSVEKDYLSDSIVNLTLHVEHDDTLYYIFFTHVQPTGQLLLPSQTVVSIDSVPCNYVGCFIIGSNSLRDVDGYLTCEVDTFFYLFPCSSIKYDSVAFEQTGNHKGVINAVLSPARRPAPILNQRETAIVEWYWLDSLNNKRDIRTDSFSSAYGDTLRLSLPITDAADEWHISTTYTLSDTTWKHIMSPYDTVIYYNIEISCIADTVLHLPSFEPIPPCVSITDVEKDFLSDSLVNVSITIEHSENAVLRVLMWSNAHIYSYYPHLSGDSVTVLHYDSLLYGDKAFYAIYIRANTECADIDTAFFVLPCDIFSLDSITTEQITDSTAIIHALAVPKYCSYSRSETYVEWYWIDEDGNRRDVMEQTFESEWLYNEYRIDSANIYKPVYLTMPVTDVSHKWYVHTVSTIRDTMWNSYSNKTDKDTVPLYLSCSLDTIILLPEWGRPEPVDTCLPGLIYRKWEDVLFCDNSDHRFISFRWYADGEPIPDSDGQWLYLPEGISGTYHVVLQTAEGQTLTSCPVDAASVPRSADNSSYSPLRSPRKLLDTNGHLHIVLPDGRRFSAHGMYE